MPRHQEFLADLSRQFHENIVHGNVIPLWAPDLWFGYGEPAFAFVSPLSFYVAEIFRVTGSDTHQALTMTSVAMLVAAMSGAFVLLHLLSRVFEGRARALAACSGALIYGFSPWSTQLLVGGFFTQQAFLATLPWVLWAGTRTALKPSHRNIALLGLAYGLFALSAVHGQFLILPLALAAVGICRKNIAAPSRLVFGIGLGLAATSFSWATAWIESALVRPQVEFGPFSSMLEMPVLTLLIFMGVTSLFGIAWSVAFLADRRHRDAQSRLHAKAAALILAVISVLAFLLHPLGGAFRDQILSGFSRLASATVFPTLLSFLCVLLVNLFMMRLAAIGPKGSALIVFFAAATLFQSYHGLYPRLPQATEKRLASVAPPAVASDLPKSAAESLVEYRRGRGENQCTRLSPTHVRCDVMAIMPATLRLNVLGYPGWTAFVNEKKRSDLRIDPERGTLLLDLKPGKSLVEWKLRNSTVRLVTKLISGLTLIFLFFLLFQKQFGKAKTHFP